MSISLQKVKDSNISSKNSDHQRLLLSVWVRAFWPITREAEFSQTWGLHRETEYCKVFHFMLLPAKSIPKILRNSRKLYFGPFLPILEQIMFFPENPHVTFFAVDFYCCAKFQKKLMNNLQEKLVTDTQAQRWTDKYEFVEPPLQRVDFPTKYFQER